MGDELDRVQNVPGWPHERRIVTLVGRRTETGIHQYTGNSIKTAVEMKCKNARFDVKVLQLC